MFLYLHNMQNFEETVEEIWKSTLKTAEEISASEPAMKGLLGDTVLGATNLFEAICKRIAKKLSRNSIGEGDMFSIFKEAFDADAGIRKNVVRDILAVKTRDPACTDFIMPVLYFKGFHAITTHRVAHWLWQNNRRHLAFYLQSLSSEIFGVDIHPAAHFGGGIMLDHATSFVAGETSRVEDNVSILHEVTLGGTSTKPEKRHPTVCSNVMIGAGAKLIGNITVHEGAKIGAGSVVLNDIPAHTTVVGVPAHKTSEKPETNPAKCMNQYIGSADIRSYLDNAVAKAVGEFANKRGSNKNKK